MIQKKATRIQKKAPKTQKKAPKKSALKQNKTNNGMVRVCRTSKITNTTIRHLPTQPANTLDIQLFDNLLASFSLLIESFSSTQTKYGKAMKPGKKYPNAFFSNLAHINYSHTYLPGILTGGKLDFVGKQFSEAEKKQFKVYRDEEGLYQLNNKNKKYFANDRYRYIVSPKGGLYIFTSRVGNFFHNAIRASEPVQCAGYVHIMNNKIISIDNASGHYRPSKEQLLRTIGGLYAAGFLNLDVKAQTFVQEYPWDPVQMKDMGEIRALIKHDERHEQPPLMSYCPH